MVDLMRCLAPASRIAGSCQIRSTMSNGGLDEMFGASVSHHRKLSN